MLWRAVVVALLLAVLTPFKAQAWSEWQGWQQAVISADGRVIDRFDKRHITTSEGQSYGLFFALVANDQAAFAKLLAWTEANLAQGALAQHLPAWLWGQAADGAWQVLDQNNASDSDAWIAYSLLEAGRLWQRPDYTEKGQALLRLSAAQSLVDIPQWGLMWLPGNKGFKKAQYMRFNASYLPLQLVDRLALEGAPWPEVAGNARRFLIDNSAQGFIADWQRWRLGQGWVNDSAVGLGSYDAIRVYLWLGMLNSDAAGRAGLLKQFRPMYDKVVELGYVPEWVSVSGTPQGKGPWGFSAAFIPFMQAQGADAKTLAPVEQALLSSQRPATEYYNYALYLFAQGFVHGYYRFSAEGYLQPKWAH